MIFLETDRGFDKVSTDMIDACAGFKDILVAMDFSPSAEAALKQAEWLSRRAGVQITLASAIPDLSMSAHRFEGCSGRSDRAHTQGKFDETGN